MYLIKYLLFIFSSFYGQHYLYAQEACTASLAEEYYEKKLPASGNGQMALRFEPLDKFIKHQTKLEELMEDLEGVFECRLKLSLRKEKVLGVKLFLANAKHLGKRIKWQHRRQLKRVFRQLQFIVKADRSPKKIPKYYKTSWLFSIENGELNLI
jgi:PhoPQ-activated pathogenicity-related protein